MKLSFVCQEQKTLPSGELVRCQKCAGCRSLKAWIKSLRVQLETVGHGGRVWLVTLTFREEQADESDAYKLVQLWLKRLRDHIGRKDGGLIRYTCVSELGSRSNRLHYHLVVYSSAEVKWRMFAKWEHGFSRFKLVSGLEAARYIMKYLSKGHGKVRSSSKLGVHCVETVSQNEVVAGVLSAFPGAVVKAVASVRVPRELQSASPGPEPVENLSWAESYACERTHYTGVSDQLWDQWKKSFKPKDMSYLELEETTSFYSDEDSPPQEEDPMPSHARHRDSSDTSTGRGNPLGVARSGKGPVCR